MTITFSQELHKGPQKSWAGCCAAQTPTPCSKSYSCVALTYASPHSSLCGMVQTQRTSGWRSGPRPLLAQVALDFLQQALFPKSVLGTCPYCCLLPQISHYSTDRCHQAGTGVWNQDLHRCQVHRNRLFPSVISGVLILSLSS